jgi:predicted permease
VKGVDTLWQDVVFTTRLLRKSPVFTAAVVLTLALGVGVNTAVFSVVNAFILRPLPVRDADRVVVVASQDTLRGTFRGVSFPDLQDYREATADTFEDIAGYSVGFLGLAQEGGRPERVLVTWVTGNYFALLDIRPTLGRLIQPEEGERDRVDPVVVLGHSTWRRRFGGSPSVIGQVVRVNGHPCTIIGVVPPDFVGTFAFSESELYLPLNWSGTGDFDNRRARNLHAIARLRPGITHDNAQAVIDVASERLARQYPDSNTNVAAKVLPERLARPEEDQFRSNARGAAIIIALVALVMIVAALNVTNLLLARAAGRRQELAIRAALGSGRGRLVRQMLMESLMLAVLGGTAGIVLGTWAADVLAAIPLPGDLPVRFDFDLDGRVLAYSVTVVLVSGLLAGVVPAVRASGADLNRTLGQSRHGSQGIHRDRIRSSMVVAQIALCFILLVAAGLFAKSLFRADRADLGFRPEGVLNVHMDVGQLGYTEGQGRAFFDDIDRRVRTIPGVQNLSFAFTIPMGYIRLSDILEAEGQPGINERLPAGKNTVSPEYFQTMGIQIVRGRSFSDADTERSYPVAVVNDYLAGTLWPGKDPVGRRFRSSGSSGPWREVVGVTNTGKYRYLFEDPQAYFYVPIAQEYAGLRVLQVRSSMPPEAMAADIERAIRAREPNLPLYDIQSMTRALGGGPGFFGVRAGAISAATFGLLGLALAIVGLYGIVAYMASQRAHEIGVRMAVGATRQDIVLLVLQHGFNLVVFGLAAGLFVALASSRVVEGFLFGVSGRDPITFALVAAALGCVALIGCAIPAWRAARVDPAITLRRE